jgi:hypothetical protein
MFSKKSFNILISLILIALILTGCVSNATATPEMTTVETAPSATPITQIDENGLVQFEPSSTTWNMPGDLEPNKSIFFKVKALKGQQLTIWLTTSPASPEIPLAGLIIKNEAGEDMSSAPVYYWSQVLPSDQVYTIEVQPYAQKRIIYSLTIELPNETVDPSLGNMYQPLDASICETLKSAGEAALSTSLGLEATAPFMDVIGGAAGQGCRIATAGDGTQFSSPQSVVQSLVDTMGMGWTVLSNYQADGPTGTSTALVRDLALMIIKANWQPQMGIECPTDKPISDCGLTDAQKFYVIEVDIAQYAANFSLDGHWVDESTGFSLDLYQDLKNVWGQHEVVAQNGNKIDSLEASIQGTLEGNVATVQFKSSFTDSVGTAEITYIDVNTIQWKIITPPDGEFYLPAEATLKR